MWDFFIQTFIGIGGAVVWGMMYPSLLAIPIVLLIISYKIIIAVVKYFKRKKDASCSDNLRSFESTKNNKYQSIVQFKIHWGISTILPAFFVIALTLMYIRARFGIGHWPQYMIDDPKGLLPHDKIYNTLGNLTMITLGFAGWSVFLWIGFFVAWYKEYSTRERKIMLWTFIIVWIIVLLTTWNTFGWLMD